MKYPKRWAGLDCSYTKHTTRWRMRLRAMALTSPF